MTGDKIDFAKLSRSEQNEIVKVIKTDFRAAKILYKTYVSAYKPNIKTYKTTN